MSGKTVARRLALAMCILIGLALFGVGMYIVVTNWRGERAKQALLGEIASLELCQAREKRLPGPPDSENGAPFLLRAFRMFEGDVSAGKVLVDTELSVRDVPLTEALPPEVKAGLSSLVKDHGEYYSLIEEGLGRPVRYGTDFSGWKHDPKAFAIMRGFRGACAHLMLLSLHRQSAGKGDDALEALCDIVKLAMTLSSGEREVPWLVRGFAGKYMLRGLENALSRTVISPRSLRSLRETIVEEERRFDIKATVEAGICSAVDVLTNLERYRQLWIKEVLRLTEGKGGQYPVLIGLWYYDEYADEWPVLTVREVRRKLRVYRFWSSVCPGTYKLLFVGKIRRGLADWRMLPLPEHELAARANDVLSGEEKAPPWPPGYARGVIEFVDYMAELRVCSAAAAIELYRVRQGDWPNALGDLAESGVPVQDPFTGEQLKYSVTRNGRILYSAGKNCLYEDGRGDDIVFRLIDPKYRPR